MDDKAVGELWASTLACLNGCWHCKEKQELIRKLVEERAERYPNLPVKDRIPFALRDFNISRATWKE